MNICAINNLINLGSWNFQVLLAPCIYTFCKKIMILQWKIIIVYLVTGDLGKKSFFQETTQEKTLGCSREISSRDSFCISTRNIHWKNYPNWAINKVKWTALKSSEICFKCVKNFQKSLQKIYIKSWIGHRAVLARSFVEYMSFDTLKTPNTIF